MLVLFVYTPELVFGSSNSFGNYYIQVSSYHSRNAALKEIEQLHKKTHKQGIIRKAQINGKTYYQVQLGPYHKLSQAKIDKQSLKNSAFIRSYGIPAYSDKHIPVLNESNGTLEKPQTSVAVHTQLVPADKQLFLSKPYYARALGEGTLAQETNFFNGDLMLPFIGTQDWIGYADLAGKYGEDSAWFGSFGGGYRGVSSGKILGAHLFADRNVSIYDQTFWMINPGLEAMNLRWDAHINGYIPASSRKKVLSSVHGSDLGLETVSFVYHTQYDSLFNTQEVTGPGMDAEIGYTWNGFRNIPNIRSFIGGYHFNLHQGPTVNGVEGGVEIPLSQYGQGFYPTLLVHDAYDQVQHNTIMATLRINMGGIEKHQPPTIQNRMLDPIQRHLGSYQTGAGVPIVKVNHFVRVDPIKDNIWFFAEGSPYLFNPLYGFANCTFEHPCGSLSQVAINDINALATNASFFINSGTYNNPLPGTGFTLNNGQSFYGRQAGFTQVAQNGNRPIITDSLFLQGNNTIDSLQIQGNTISTNVVPPFTNNALVGIEVLPTATGTIFINNTAINVTASSIAADVTGLRIMASDPSVITNVTDTTITTHISNSPNFYVHGIDSLSSSTLNVSNSQLTANSLYGSGNSGIGGAFGLRNQLNGNLTVNQSQITGNAINSSDGEGLQNTGTGTVAINNSIITGTANGADSSTESLSFGMFISGGGSVTLNQSTVISQQSGGSIFSSAVGITNFNSPVTLNQTSVSATTEGNKSATGVNNFGVLNLMSSYIAAATGNPAMADAIDLNGGAGVVNNLDNRSVCTENGVQVPCS